MSPEKPKKSDPGQRILNALQDNAAQGQSLPVKPLFADARPLTIHTPTPLERIGTTEAQDESREALEAIVADPTFAATAMGHAQELVAELPKGLMEDGEELRVAMGEFVTSLGGQYTPEEKDRMVAECVDAISNLKGLDSLVGNPLAQFFAKRGQLTRRSLEMKMTAGTEGTVATPNPHAYAARAAVVFTAAAAGLILEIGTTKTAAIQLIDIYNPPGISHLVQAIATQLQSYGYDPTLALSSARFAIAATIAAGIGTTLLATKGLKALGPKGKIAMYGSLGASLGLGYLALQNFVIDNATVAEMGRVISAEYKPVAEQGRTAKDERKKASEAAQKSVQTTLAAEINRPTATGYGHFSAFLDKGLTGNLNSETFKTAAPQKHTALQATIKELQKKYFAGDESKGLMHLLAQLDAIDLETAPRGAELVAELGAAAAKTTLWTGLGKVLNPLSGVTTPTAMHEQAQRVTGAFKAMLESDAKETKRIGEAVQDWIQAMLAVARTQGADQNLLRSLEALKGDLASKLRPVGAQSAAIEAAFARLPKPSGKWTIATGDNEFAQMQKTIDGTFLTTAFGFELDKDSSSRAFYRAGFASILLSFFLLLNYGSKYLTNKLHARREGDFALDIAKGSEDINAKEGAFASNIARFLAVANKEFTVQAGAPEFAMNIPESVTALYVRRRLREVFLEEVYDGEPGYASRFGWLVHGVIFTKTPEDVKVFNAYTEWLNQVIESANSLDTGGAMLEKLMKGLFPAFSVVVDSFTTSRKNNADPEKRKELRQALRKLRRTQLIELATALEDRLKVIGIGEENDEARNEDGVQGLGSLRLDVDGTRTIVEPRLVMRALAHSLHKDERRDIEHTLAYLSSLGITSRPEHTADEVRIGRFDVGPLSAVKDQLAKQRAMVAAGIPEATGNADDFSRFDSYMAEVALSLREARDTAIQTEDLLKPYKAVFEWQEGLNGRFTVRISLFSDAERIAAPVASVTFPGTIPDFNKPDPTEACAQLRQWLLPGSDAVRGLIAQERNTALQRKQAEVFASLRKHPGIEPPKLVLVGSRVDTATTEDVVSLFQEAYNIDEMLEEQNPSLRLAKEGRPIPEDKYRAFIEPERYSSNSRSYVHLQKRFADIVRYPWPARTSVVYNPTFRSFIVTRTTGGLLRKGDTTTEVRLRVAYTEEEIASLISTLEQEVV